MYTNKIIWAIILPQKCVIYGDNNFETKQRVSKYNEIDPKPLKYPLHCARPPDKLKLCQTASSSTLCQTAPQLGTVSDSTTSWYCVRQDHNLTMCQTASQYDSVSDSTTIWHYKTAPQFDNVPDSTTIWQCARQHNNLDVCSSNWCSLVKESGQNLTVAGNVSCNCDRPRSWRDMSPAAETCLRL